MNKVWGIGLGRTGTRSLCKALEIMGFKAIHEPPFLDSFEGYDAAAAGACMSDYRFLDLRYPESQFVLTVREIDAWLDSCRRAMEQYPESRMSPGDKYYNAMIRNRAHRYGTLVYDEKKMVQNYRRHESQVTDYFADRPEKLLVWNVSENGQWEPLCKFLGMKIPQADFPHITGLSGKRESSVRFCGNARE
jgi:hypothetical protein